MTWTSWDIDFSTPADGAGGDEGDAKGNEWIHHGTSIFRLLRTLLAVTRKTIANAQRNSDDNVPYQNKASGWIHSRGENLERADTKEHWKQTRKKTKWDGNKNQWADLQTTLGLIFWVFVSIISYLQLRFFLFM